MLDLIQQIDERIILAVNGWNSPFFDDAMWWISGKFTWWPFYLALIIFIFYRKNWKKGLMIVFSIVLVITLADQTSVHFFKEVFERLRPSHNPELADKLHIINNYRGGKYGFISSHASNSFAVAGFLSMVFRLKWFSIVLMVWAALVSYSRMYLGVHYFTDVFVGALWGLLIGWLVYRLYKIVCSVIFHE